MLTFVLKHQCGDWNLIPNIRGSYFPIHDVIMCRIDFSQGCAFQAGGYKIRVYW